MTTLVAHVRGVPYSENVTVGEPNLHPFRYKGYRCDGPQWPACRLRPHALRLGGAHQAEIARLIRGDTDSEWIYAVLLSQLDDPRGELSPDVVVQAVDRTLSIIREVRSHHDINTSSPTNLFISDGRFVVAVRFAFDYGCYDMNVPYKNVDHNFLGIWYTTGKAYSFQDGEWKMIRAPIEAGRSLLISSEPLTRICLDMVRGSRIQCPRLDGRGMENSSWRVRYLDV